jgi:hypothetical protein
MIEGTITATLLERAQPGAIAQRREATGGLLSVEDFASYVANAAVDDIETGEVILAGGLGAGLSPVLPLRKPVIENGECK